MNVQCRLRCWKVRPVRVFILTSWQSAQMLMRRARLFWTRRHKCIELRFRVDASTQELRVPSWLTALQEKHRKTIQKGPTAFLLIKTDSHLMLVAHTEQKSGHQKRFQWRIVTICHNNAPAEFNQTNFHKGFLLQSCQQIMFCSRTQPHRDKIYCATHHEVQCLELEASWKVCALNILRRSRSKWWRSKPTELEQKLPKAKQHTISLMWVASETVCIGSPAASWPAGEAPSR